MARTTTWQLTLVTIAAVLALTLVPGDTGRASDATPDHEAHHEATPAADVVCDVATPATADHGAGGMAGAGTATPGMGTTGEFDLMFIDMMIPHHESAVAMARVALVRAEHEEIRTLADGVIASQGAEIDQMRGWRQAWYPDAPQMAMDQMMGTMGEMMQGMPGMEATDMMGMMGMAMDPAGEVAALCAAPEPFDLAFIDAMIPHHRSAIAMAQVALERAANPEIRQLAQQIIDAQQREIAQMENWRETWYGGTPAAG